MVGGEVKIATVENENSDNMATLPVSRGNDSEKNAAIKEMEIKGVQPKPDKRKRLMLAINNLNSKLIFIVDARQMKGNSS
ncbi:hypothetical protein HHI36_009512 [Cryptolaemus montrouzieri]|uniref:Uncharacterized protein n=1 Tax=Cryptolaemus montrouzieri TaxID=559131 RepID=A0ABD2MGI6_9CUCU